MKIDEEPTIIEITVDSIALFVAIGFFLLMAILSILALLFI